MGDLGSKIPVILRERELFFLRAYIAQRISETKLRIKSCANLKQVQDKFDLIELENALVSIEYAINKHMQGSS